MPKWNRELLIVKNRISRKESFTDKEKKDVEKLLRRIIAEAKLVKSSHGKEEDRNRMTDNNRKYSPRYDEKPLRAALSDPRCPGVVKQGLSSKKVCNGGTVERDTWAMGRSAVLGVRRYLNRMGFIVDESDPRWLRFRLPLLA